VGRCDSAVIGVDVLAMRELMHAKHTLSINTNSAFPVSILTSTRWMTSGKGLLRECDKRYYGASVAHSFRVDLGLLISQGF